MKKLLIILLLFISSSAVIFSQNDDEAWKNQTYIKEQPLTKEKAYDVVIMWAAKHFISSNFVIQFKDKEMGKIILQLVGTIEKGFLNIKMDFRYTFTISLKDKKIKYEFETHGFTDTGRMGNNNEDEITEYYLSVVDLIQNELTNYKDDGF